MAERMLNMSVLDGVRCLTCLSVMLLHVHYVFGGIFFPSTHWRMLEIHKVPVVGSLIFSVSSQLTTFWIMSGFLCEHQLTQRQSRLGKNLGVLDYASFFLNRLLRLYPLYLVIVLLTFHSAQTQDDVSPDDKCVIESLIPALFFAKSVSECVKCASVGWSIVADVHGYVAAMILFALLPGDRNRTLKKWLLGLAYIASLVRMTAYMLSQDSTARQILEERGPFGLDILADREIHSFDGAVNVGLKSLHKDLDWQDPLVVAIREFHQNMLRNVYLTSIDKHASAFLLGILLCMNLHERQGRPSRVMYKLFGAAGILYVTSARYAFTGISVYLLLDVLLTLPSEVSRWNAMILTFFSNRIWKALAPYTYGMYLFHIIFLFVRATSTFREWAAMIADGGDPGHEYGWKFIFVEWTIDVLLALITAVILHCTIEWPFTYIRKRWLKRSTKTLKVQ